MKQFEEQYAVYADAFENALKAYCAQMKYRPQILTDSMRYSLLLGGKRLRPVLFLSTLDFLGQDWLSYLDLAIAIEMIHTYSLIHDDLPAMDNDDFRRGKPSNHKKFGEANAILAGDALLNTAYSILFRESGKGERYLRAARYLCDAAGADGMISGQSADLLYSETQTAGSDALEFIYERKTGKLIAAPLVMAAILADKYYFEMEQFGFTLGSLFQMTDDILDEKGDTTTVGKTLGKDKAENKLTCIKVYGMHASELQADLLAERCYGILEGIIGDVSFLNQTVSFVRDRNK